jgi:UDP-glucose 4-epimerase
MKLCRINKLVFSSSATVYGEPEYLPLDERHRLNPVNPYGRTKLYIENILSDLCLNNNDLSVVCLRYFNPIGAHKTGIIGENPKGIPENIMPFILKVVSGELDLLEIFGNDYDTPDGSCLRDYIHIEDLVEAHVKSLDFLSGDTKKNFNVFNVGTGKPISVIELVGAFEKASKLKINQKFSHRRKGDVSSCYADTKLSKKELNWEASRNLDSMCESAWKYINMPKSMHNE